MADESAEIHEISEGSQKAFNPNDVASRSINIDSEMIEEGSSQEYTKNYKWVT